MMDVNPAISSTSPAEIGCSRLGARLTTSASKARPMGSARDDSPNTASDDAPRPQRDELAKGLKDFATEHYVADAISARSPR
jgi:hypothetical protein